MAQSFRKKYKVKYDQRASKFINICPKKVRLKLLAISEILEHYGKLEYPVARKLKGTKYLYEVRIKFDGEYRFIYAYIGNEFIVFLSGFRKKQNKTPLNEIDLAKSRLKNYL